jgi:crotonobetainyl-CoA:carnitine CoA-transferase CaiB-like acyl-CoA transferase
MFESMAAWVMVEHLYGETFQPPIDTIGYKRILNPYRRPFKTKDGYCAILPYTDQNWRDFSRWSAARTCWTTRATRRSARA